MSIQDEVKTATVAATRSNPRDNTTAAEARSYPGDRLPSMVTPHTPRAYAWKPLTAELRDSKSPVTIFVKQHFPHLKEVQRQYRDSVGALTVDSRGYNAGTTGEAFDWAVRFLLHPRPSLTLALVGVARRYPQLAGAAIEMAQGLGIERGSSALDARLGTRFDGPVAGSVADEETLLRGCWALALLTQVYRLGGIHPNSDLATLDLDRVRAADLLNLTPPAVVEELGHLRLLARSALLPALADRTGPWAIGPTFVGSKIINADADLIADGLLVDLKTNLGDKRADGGRRAGLDATTLYQLLGYVLLDFTDEFAIDHVGIYAARYGHLTTWRLPELLDELAGRPVELAAERTAFADLLLGPAQRRAAPRPATTHR